jgi:hypothetical protein
MKKIATLLALGLLVLAGCSNLFIEPRKQSAGETPAIPPGYGALRVSLVRGAARTIMPQADLDALFLEYWFAKDGGEPEKLEPVEGGEFALPPGSYTLEVRALAVAGDPGSLAARGETDTAFAANADTRAELSIVLRPILGEGEGSLAFNLEFPEDARVETLTLTLIAGDDPPLDLRARGTLSGATLSGTAENIPGGYYLLRAVLRNSAGAPAGRVEVVHIYDNLTAVASYVFTADNFRVHRVTGAGDSGPGSLRQAIIDALAVTDGPQLVQVLLPPGSVITLESPLPQITRSMTIEGGGVTLTPAWTSATATSQMLYISDAAAEVTIRRVHFKDGLTTNYGSAIWNIGILTLESCVFSGNRVESGAAVYSTNTLTVRGSSFYGNSAVTGGGAVYFYGSNKYLTLTGNLFYGNTVTGLRASKYPVVLRVSGIVAPLYNVVDADFGTGSGYCGWVQGEGDVSIGLAFAGLPVSPLSFKLLYGSGAADKLPDPLPEGYPALDFFGNPVSGGGAAGAVQARTANQSGYYYPDLLVNYKALGSVTANPAPDEDGLVSAGSVTITAKPENNCILAYWLVDGENQLGSGLNTLTISLSGHTRVEAIFRTSGRVDNFSDGPGSETTQGTLRYALTNATDGDIITFIGVTPGVTTITLTSPLPEITKSITIEGAGVTLTRPASVPTRLLYIGADTAEVTIRRVHFKAGDASGLNNDGGGFNTNYGGAIFNSGTLTLESCIFANNRGANYAGAIFSRYNSLTIRGCTFYNTVASNAPILYFDGRNNGGILTLAGNLFYGNTWSAVTSGNMSVNGTLSASSNVGDFTYSAVETLITELPVTPFGFMPLSGSAVLNKLPSPLPEGYPVTDFYGNAINAGGAAGAAQRTGTGYFLDVAANRSSAGSFNLGGASSDGNGFYSSGSSVTIQAVPNSRFAFSSWLVNGIPSGSANPLSITLDSDTWVQAVFSRLVTDFSDGPDSATTEGTLRYALANVVDGDVITFTGVTPGTTTITLQSNLPTITKSMTIEGSGVTLTRAASWTASATSQLLRINVLPTATEVVEVTIRGVHFKNGLTTDYGAAVRATIGILILESCIFSGGESAGSNGSGAVYGNRDLTIRGCTFYGNRGTEANTAGAVYFAGTSGRTLTMTGNLFYGNTAASYPALRRTNTASTLNASYNMADADFMMADGVSSANTCGWAAGTGDVFTANLPLSPASFKLLQGSAALNRLPSPLPEGYPATDFYGNAINAGGAAGAAQDTALGAGYSLDLSVNNLLRGSVTVSGASPDPDGFYPSGSNITITASPHAGYYFERWLIDGIPAGSTNPLKISNLSAHTQVKAVFNPEVTVFADNEASATIPGTLRYALTNAQDGDVIKFTGVAPGTTTIELASALPQVTKSIAIEGAGVTLTRTASWNAGSATSQLLYINAATAVVTVRRVHFKDGLATDYGAAIRTTGILTLESCIFSGGESAGSNGGGGLYSNNDLTIRGCGFYNNSGTAANTAGAVQFAGASGKTLTLTGNLFYGNTAASYPVVRRTNAASTLNASYNVADADFMAAAGASSANTCGWAAGTGDTTLAALGIDGAPFDPATLAPLSALGNVLPSPKPADFPDTDFYGAARTFPGAPGAVK